MNSPQNTMPDAPAVEEDAFLASLRIDQSYNGSSVGVKRLLITVPIRKPGKTEFVRVHPDFWIDCFALELKIEREFYFVPSALAQILAEFVEPVRLRLCVTRQGTASLWPVKLPKDDRRPNSWHTSAAEGAALAEKKWTRLTADMQLGAYQPFVATADLGEPKWPEESWPEVMKVALRDRLIDSTDHAVVRELLGQS